MNILYFFLVHVILQWDTIITLIKLQKVNGNEGNSN